jgi:class 3 adenylate cyclase
MVMNTSAGILFLDVKGYSDLDYKQLRDYHKNIYKALSEIVEKGEKGEPYVYKKTWGDGLVLAHKDMYKLATVALEIRDYFRDRKFEQNSDGALSGRELLCRIAIHYAEFDTIDDPIDKTKSCFGDAVILPARIEPVTEPGHVWATNLATHYIYNKQKNYGLSQISWLYKGLTPLAKRFGEHHIWEILKVGEKDANGNKGTQEEPNVPATTKKVSTGTASEPYKPITNDEGKRVEALTGKDPIVDNISICSRDRSIDECPAKARTVLAISEMERNGQSASEETQIAHWIHEIYGSTEHIVNCLDSTQKKVRWKDIWTLKENIKRLFECFKEFVRDKTWPDTYDWPASFLSWRLKTLNKKDAEEISKIFIDFGRKFLKFIEDNYIEPKNAPKFKPDDITNEIDECLRYLLGKEAEQRLGTIKRISRGAFDSFDRLLFAKHIEDLTVGLSSYTDVAEVWL